MKVSKKEIYMLLALLGVVIAICAWQFGFKKINTKVEALQADTELLQADINKYSKVKDSIAVYQKGIEDANNKIAKVLSDFPVDVIEEDAFMLGREFEKCEEHTFVSAAAINNDMVIFNASSQPVEATTQPVTYSLNRQQVSYSYTTPYEGFKGMVDYIFAHKNRMSLDNFALAYDEGTGLLTGTTLVDMYYVTGTDKEYTSQNLSGVSTGTDNIFGSIDLSEIITETE